MAKSVGFSREDAGRIAKTVRRVEGEPTGSGAVGWWPYVADGAGMKLCKTTAVWNIATEQELVEYTGSPSATITDPSWEKVTAWNSVANLPTGTWVIVGFVGGHYYLLAFRLTQLAGYNATKQQILGHNTSGVLTWLDTTVCP